MEQARPRAASDPASAAAYEGGAGRPSAPPGVRVPAQVARGEHTHSEPTAPAAVPVPGVASGAGSGVAAGARSGVASAAAAGPAPGGAAAAPVQRHSVRGQILEALRAALVGGELEPGEVYSAPALAARFGVSATPVREAMQQLAHEGAVEVVPNRGFRVAERSARELAELIEIRSLLEVPVMLRLARTVPADQWCTLRPLAEATVTAAARGDIAGYVDADRAFHGAILALSGNRQLVMVADDLHRRSQWPLATGPVHVRRADLIADAAEHTALLDALVAQDLAVVSSLVREHFNGAQ